MSQGLAQEWVRILGTHICRRIGLLHVGARHAVPAGDVAKASPEDFAMKAMFARFSCGPS